MQSSNSGIAAAFSPADAALLCTFISAQMDRRFAALDMSCGSRIVWSEVAGAMSDRSQRQWTEAMCQRLWRYCAYGEDIGSRPAPLPDSDGEESLPFSRQASPAEMRASLEAVFSRTAHDAVAASSNVSSFALAAASASMGGGLTRRSANPAVAAAALPDAAHAVVDRTVRQLLGSLPVKKRAAIALFQAHYRRDAVKLVAEETAAAEAAVAAAQTVAASLTHTAQMMAAAQHQLPGDPALVTDATRAAAAVRADASRQEAAAAEERLAAARRALSTARSMVPSMKVQAMWDALASQPQQAAQKQEWELRALIDERRWADEERAYAERYSQLYRVVALQTELLAHQAGQLADLPQQPAPAPAPAAYPAPLHGPAPPAGVPMPAPTFPAT